MPALRIDIEAKFAQVLDALEQVNRASKRTADSFNTLSGSFKRGLFDAISAELRTLPGQLVGLVKGSIDAADHLNDLSKKTGVAVDVLGGLGFAASQAGGDLESVTAAAGKLNKSIAEAAGGNKEVGVAFKALGISVRDTTGALKTADVIMAEIADKFAEFEDGPEKAAIALRLFGKAGADIIPLLNDGGKALRDNIEYYKRFSGVTKEVAEQADAFNDTMGKLNLISGAFGRTITASLLPPMQALADGFLHLKENTEFFAIAAKAMSGVFGVIASQAKDVALAIYAVVAAAGSLGAQISALARADLKGFTAIQRAVIADIDKAKEALDKFGVRVKEAKDYSSNDGIGSGEVKKKRAPLIPGKGGTEDNPEKTILEGKLKELEKVLALERDALDFQATYLNKVYDAGIISLQAFYDEKRAIDNVYLADALATYDKEIAALKAYQSTAAKATDRAEAENKINDIYAKRAKLIQDSGQKAQLDSFAQKQAAEEYRKKIDEINTELLELAGNKSLAARRKIDARLDDVRKLATKSGADPEIVNQLGDALKQQQDYNDLLERAGLLNESLSTIEGRIALERKTGSKTELEALAASDAARAKMSASLSELADKYEALSAANPFNEELKAKAEAFRLKVDELAASGKQLEQVFTDIGEGAFASFLTDVMSGTKSISQAFKDMVRSITSELNKIAAKELASKLFGTGGGSSGSGGFASIIGSVIGLFSGGGGSGYADDLPTRGGRAIGGPVSPFQEVWVGEHGPEKLRMGSQGGTVIPNPVAMGGNSGPVYVTINTPDANSFRASEAQITSQMSRFLQRSRRNA